MARVLVRWLPVTDPWEPIPQQAFVGVFGPSTPRFESFLEGDSDVRIDSVEAMCEWLLACQYADSTDRCEGVGRLRHGAGV